MFIDPDTVNDPVTTRLPVKIKDPVITADPVYGKVVPDPPVIVIDAVLDVTAAVTPDPIKFR
jgi:hypothetical protein